MTKIMGVLNVTPDSFAGDGIMDIDTIVARAVQMEADGADIIDIGAESTRPSARHVSLEEELARVGPVVKAVASTVQIPVSIDTYKPGVARVACMSGASIINDVSGSLEAMVQAAVDYGAKLIISHNEGGATNLHQTAATTDIANHVLNWLMRRSHWAEDLGLPEADLWLDPGIGFGKGLTDNTKLLRGLPSLVSLGFPVLVGASRKGFLGQLAGHDDPSGRDYATAAVTAYCVAHRVGIVRVHNVPAARDVIAVSMALLA